MSGLEIRAAELWPHNESMQRKWVAAVKYLRAGRGWTLDQMAQKKEQRPLLHGYVATPPVVTHTALPDEVVIPGSNVKTGPWSKSSR